MKIAFFEPWHGGSHRAFLDAWTLRTRHEITVHGLPARHWKWRQESSAWELARRVIEEPAPDLVACSDYVDLPRLLGFLPETWRALPTLAYFHENQLTYGEAVAGQRAPDFTHGFCNVLTAVRAGPLVVNNPFHHKDFGKAASELLRKLPKPGPREELRLALERAHVVPPLPELEAVPLGSGGPSGAPLRAAFPHRMEPDKDPCAFFEAVTRAREHVDLELILLGGDLRRATPAIQEAARRASDITSHAGFAEDRAEYLHLLGGADVVVSTAHHEFFGVAFLEALAAGCQPLAPDRLNYPSLVAASALHVDGEDLVRQLIRWGSPEGLAHARDPAQRRATRAGALDLDASRHATRLDDVCEDAAVPY
ncbi:MAG: DUF3524 domain-containing protein [Planctomycetota bacterium]